MVLILSFPQYVNKDSVSCALYLKCHPDEILRLFLWGSTPKIILATREDY